MATKTKNEAAPFGGVLYGPDASRAATWSAPLRVCPGRGIVDARGRLIAQTAARRALDDDGYMREAFEPAGLAPVEADANAHAIAHALNLAAFDALTESQRAHVDTFRANLARAVFNRETVTVSGGVFAGDELRAVVAALAAFRGDT